MSGLILRRQAMMAAIADPAPKYLASTSYTSITLPFTPNDNPIIDVTCYLAKTTMGISGSYYPVLSIGNVTSPGFYIKSWNQVNFEPRSWSGGQLLQVSPPLIAYQINYSDKTFSATKSNNTTVSGVFSGNTANANNFVLRIRDLFMTQRINVIINGVEAYNFVASLDNNGVACLEDTLTGNYYYDTEGTAILTRPPK